MLHFTSDAYVQIDSLIILVTYSVVSWFRSLLSLLYCYLCYLFNNKKAGFINENNEAFITLFNIDKIINKH